MARVKNGRGQNRGVYYIWDQNTYVVQSTAVQAEAMPQERTGKSKSKHQAKERERGAKKARKEADMMARQQQMAEESLEDDDENEPVLPAVTQRAVSPPVSQLSVTPDTIPDVVAKGIILKDTLRITRIMKGNKVASKPSTKEQNKGVGAKWYIAVYQSLARLYTKGSNNEKIDAEVDCFKKVVLPHSTLHG